jgi:hypothetical protein
MRLEPPRTPKKRYQAPNLLVYGDLTQMTKTNPKNTGMPEMPSGKPAT